MRSRSTAPISETEPHIPEKKRGSVELSPFAMLVIAIVLGTAIVLGVSSLLHRPAEQHAQEQQAPSVAGSSDADIAQLIAAVGKHIVINTSEQPTVATVLDADTLRTQVPAFYRDAQNGDRVLVWSDKAVLYSPSRDILLAVLPVSMSSVSSTAIVNPVAGSTSASSTAERATIEVRNGTPTAGLGRSLADKLKAAGFTVLSPTQAKANNYPTTIIIKANKKPFPQTLSALQAATNAQVVDEPSIEGQIKGDFLVIVGSDYAK
jgi:hypothetical protein